LASQQDAALKLGRIQKINQDWCQRINRGVTEFEGAYLSHCKVIGATCIGVASKGDVSDIEFDWVIVDEAGRSTYPELVVPLVRGRKIVLVGDHRQLPPIVDKELTDDLLEEIEVLRKNLETSLFKDMIQPDSGKVTKTQSRLKVQYRMSREIGDLISKCFYDGDLRHAGTVGNINHKQKWINTPVVWFSTKKLKRHEENKVGFSFQNMVEAEITKSILDKLEVDLASQNITRSVGIIAGYMGQKRLFRQQIGRDFSLWPHMRIEINTVDAYQGQEKDYIIYSVVRSNAQHKIGFLQDERRLNLALSRARELLIIIGDPETVEFANTGGRDNPFFRVLKHIHENVSDCSFREYEL
jgi:superfamily I DNA and/or RNA helicase